MWYDGVVIIETIGVCIMQNPFLNRVDDPEKSDYLTSVCSINRIRLQKLPVYGVDDGIEGLTVKEFFSTKLVIEEIKKFASQLSIDLSKNEEKRLPKLLSDKLSSKKTEVALTARTIAEKFGKRLGLLFLALKLGEQENRQAREDWNDKHWEYWAQVNDIILVGGLASGKLGEVLKECVEYVFSLVGVIPYNIILYDNAADVGVLGCSTQLSSTDGVNIVMDFGQTNIKRCYVTKSRGEITDIKKLESYPSKYMDWEMPSPEEKLRQAKKLHQYLLKAIEDTYNTAKTLTKTEPNSEIVISIASYTIDGALNAERSGYAKLCTLGKNYAECLWWELSGRLRRDVVIKLIHDGTAIALNFSDRKNTVCLSLGSYLGVGFPETKLVWPQFMGE